MRRMTLAVAWSLAACVDPGVETVELTAVEHGEQLFRDPAVSGATQNRTACIDCHDVTTTRTRPVPGAPLAGATLRPSYWGGQEASLLRATNACLYYFMSSSLPWTGEEKEARAIFAYLESLEPGNADAQDFTIGELRDPSDGDGARGKSIFEEACATCHGAANSGIGALIPTSPRLPVDWLADHPSPDYDDAERRLVFVEKTRHGGFLGYGGQMPPLPLEALSDQGLADILAYLEVP